MRGFRLWSIFCVMLSAGVVPLSVTAQNFSGFVGVDTRNFGNTTSGTSDISSVVIELRAAGDSSENLSYDLRLFGSSTVDGGSFDYIDPKVAKLTWQSGSWQVDVGYDLVFWGVAEGRNLVNIINQRDQIRDSLGDQGLGQSMVALRYFGASTTVEAFVLPRFEELSFGEEGRPWSLGFPVREEAATFESANGAAHVDFALRFSGLVGNVEFAPFVFDGTLREPQFVFDAATNSLSPHYRQGRVFGVEAQYTSGAFLYKLEATHTNPDTSSDYWAAIAGVEYAVASLFGRPWETAFFAEYNYDSRQNDPAVVFENDLFLGAQIRFPNTLGTELQIGAIIDLEDGDYVGSVSLASRLTDNLRASAEYIYIEASDPTDGLFPGRNDDQLSLTLEWHF